MRSSHLYPEIDPYAHGLLEVGDGNCMCWECCGTPSGKPAVVLHGGPGSGCSPWMRRLFDPSAYRVVLFDQRNCGRSTPNASLHRTDLASNTTSHLIHDIEQLRCHLGIQGWLVLGGSWGSTLALAYAETHPECVTEMILFGVTTGQRSEFDWLFRGGLARLFPQQWERLLSWLPREDRDGDIVEAYRRWLNSPDPAICEQAALEWCMWESATPEWPPSSGLARNCYRLADIPGVLINGRFDFQSTVLNAWQLKRAWKTPELIVINNAGHWVDESISGEIIRATDRFAE